MMLLCLFASNLVLVLLPPLDAWMLRGSLLRCGFCSAILLPFKPRLPTQACMLLVWQGSGYLWIFVCLVTADSDLFLWVRLITTVLRLHSRLTFRVASRKVDGIGSNRRLWLKVQPCSGRCFFWLVFYLPANDEARWHEEVDGIDRDAATIFSQASPQIPILFWMGDANLQPSAMGKGADPKPSRDRRWESLIKKWSVLLWNPPGLVVCHAPFFFHVGGKRYLWYLLILTTVTADLV